MAPSRRPPTMTCTITICRAQALYAPAPLAPSVFISVPQRTIAVTQFRQSAQTATIGLWQPLTARLTRDAPRATEYIGIVQLILSADAARFGPRPPLLYGLSSRR